MTITCHYPECTADLQWRGTGRKPRFCETHRSGKFRTAASRSRGVKRPQCCVDAAPALKCSQHKEEMPSLFEADHFADYAGAAPKAQHNGFKEVAGPAVDAGLAIKGESAALRMPVGGNWFDPGLIYARYVIGQRDLDADWHPVNPRWREGFDEKVGYVKERPQQINGPRLISRGADWPWAEAELEAAA